MDVLGQVVSIYDLTVRVATYAKAVKDAPADCQECLLELGIIEARLTWLKGRHLRAKEEREGNDDIPDDSGPDVDLENYQESASKMGVRSVEEGYVVVTHETLGVAKKRASNTNVPTEFMIVDPKSRTGSLFRSGGPVEKYQKVMVDIKDKFEDLNKSKLVALKYPDTGELDVSNLGDWTKSRIQYAYHSLLWPWKSSGFKDQLGVLKFLNSSLDSAVMDDLSRVVEGIDQKLIAAETDRQLQIARESLARIEEQVSTVDYEKAHALRQEKRIGLGKWLLESPQFTNVLTRSAPTNLVWVQGEPGAGKSTLMSRVIDALYNASRDLHNQEDSKSQDWAVIYFYFSILEERSQTLDAVLRALIRQLLSQPHFSITTRASEFVNIMKEYEEEHEQNSKKVVTAFQRLLDLFPRTYLVLDAMNEADDNVAERLFAALTDEQDPTKLRPKLKLICTSLESRRGILTNMGGSEDVFYKTKEEDIELYVRKRLDDRDYAESQLFSLIDGKKSLQDHIVKKVKKAAGDVVLMAKLHIDALQECADVGEIHIKLHNLPTTPDEAYTQFFEYLTDPKLIGKAKVVLGILSVIYSARRPLTVEEAQYAYALEQYNLDHEKRLKHPQRRRRGSDDDFVPSLEDHIPSLDHILEQCDGFVVVEKGYLNFVSKTLRSYLQKHETFVQKDGKAAHPRMAIRCLKYLSFSEFDQDQPEDANGLKTFRNAHPFLSYASMHWGWHLRQDERDRDAKALALSFLKSQKRSSTAIKHLTSQAVGYWPGAREGKPTSGVTSLHVLAHFGLACTFKEFYRDSGVDVNHQDYWGITPFLVVARSGDKDMAKLLLDELHADINHRDICKRNALSFCTEWGTTDVLSLVMESINELNAEIFNDQGGAEFRSPLGWAALKNHVDIVEVLIEKANELAERGIGTINFNSQDVDFKTALHLASEHGHDDIVEILVNTGKCDVNRIDRFKRTALHWAILGEHEETVRLLIEDGKANVNITPGGAEPPIFAAAFQRNPAIITMLLEKGADPNATGIDLKRKPLGIAAMCNSLEIIKALVEGSGSNKADINGMDIAKRTPLFWAAWHAKHGAVDMLIKLGADVNALNDLHETPLMVAALTSKPRVVERLLETRKIEKDENGEALPSHRICDPDIKDRGGRTAISLMAEWRRENLVKILYEGGADPNVPGPFGRTGFAWAAERCSLECVEMLLDRSDPSIPDVNGWTASDFAVANVRYFKYLEKPPGEIEQKESIATLLTKKHKEKEESIEKIIAKFKHDKWLQK